MSLPVHICAEKFEGNSSQLTRLSDFYSASCNVIMLHNTVSQLVIRILLKEQWNGIAWFHCMDKQTEDRSYAGHILFQPFKTLWLFHILPGLTLTNFMFCPAECTRFSLWIWEKAAIISPYSINWLILYLRLLCLLHGTNWVCNYNSG
jgi:hypothetical protein